MKSHKMLHFILFYLNPVRDSDVRRTLQRPPQVVSDPGYTSRAGDVLWLRMLSGSAILK